jgi:hypothetical protein
VKNLLAFGWIADVRLDSITGEAIGAYVAKRRESKLEYRASTGNAGPSSDV